MGIRDTSSNDASGAGREERRGRDVCAKLDELLAQWEGQHSATHHGLAERVSEIRVPLEALGDLLNARNDGLAGVAKAIRAEMGPLRAAFADACTAAEKQARRVAQLEDQLKASANSLQQAQERIAQLEKALERQERNDLEGSRRVSDLENALRERAEAAEAARKRATQLEQAAHARAEASAEVARRAEELAKELDRLRDAQRTGVRRAEDLEKRFEEREELVTASAKRIRELEEEQATARAELQDLRTRAEELAGAKEALIADINETRAALDEARREANALRPAAEKAGDLQGDLEAERRRADDLEDRLRQESASGSRALIAAQLAEALRDAEAAQNEARALRAELEALRRSIPSGEESAKATRRGRKEREAPKRQMGEILVEAGALTPAQLEQALEEHRKSPQRALGDLLVEMGLSDEDTVAQALATQYGVLFVRLDESSFEAEAPSLISGRLAQHHTCIPLRKRPESSTLVLAMVDPLNLIAIEDVERTTSLTVHPVLATPSAIAAAIKRHYPEA